MTWAGLLLADRSPLLRRLVLTELLERGGTDPEVRELSALVPDDPLLSDLRGLQADDGSFKPGALPGTAPAGRTLTTAQALERFGYAGIGTEDAAVARGCAFLFSRQAGDGSWPLQRNSAAADEGERASESYSMIPLQTALPLRALAACGLAEDPRSERAYGWLLAQRLEDGAWPTGIAAGNFGRVAGYRRLAHSRWGCRSNTTAALTCLALHPTRRHGEEARRALDLLLGRETRERHTLGYTVARTIGLEPSRGFLTYYARFDLAQVLDLCRRIGASTEDPRVADIVAAVRDCQGPFGLWTYQARPEADRWVTFDILRSLNRLDREGDWVGSEPRTPFRAYGPRERRF